MPVKTQWIVLTFLLGISPLFGAGCAQKPLAAPSNDPYEAEAATSEDPTQNNSDTGPAMGLRTVHFDYRSSQLNGAAQEVLRANAQVLNANLRIAIQIEGHCDDRGGPQGNFELGQRRAEAVQKQLRQLGVLAGRMSVISYGKESPIATGDSEEARAKNRRANFVITSK